MKGASAELGLARLKLRVFHLDRALAVHEWSVLLPAGPVPAKAEDKRARVEPGF